jgi:hypothetical protein
MVTYLEDTDVLEIYNGTAYVPVSGEAPILQIKSTSKTDTFTTTSTSFTSVTGLSASITPKSTASKILVLASLSASVDAVAGNGVYARITGGNSTNFVGDTAGTRPRAFAGYTDYQSSWQAARSAASLSINLLDSPATISSVNYEVQIRGVAGSSVYVNRSGDDADLSDRFGRFASTITLMEVAA